MRELILIRHAQAVASTGGQDSERTLSNEGRRQAAAINGWLRQHAVRPQRILCSTAERARETATLALDGLSLPDPLPEPRIYEATAGELLDLVIAAEPWESLMLVGHNPGFETLAALLVDGRSTEYRGLPTAGVVYMQFEPGTGIEPGAARLREFWSPG